LWQSPWKFKTGCSSIPFGAIPVCPCFSYQNPTPVIVTDPASFSHDEDETAPRLFRKSCRACAIFVRLKGEATHAFLGSSTIIIFAGAVGTEITRCMSLSSSSFAWVGRAFTFHVWNSTAP
jgi:hypothetical protein